MTASVEQKKRQYSDQLAAHTLRQWNAVQKEPTQQRKTPEQENGSTSRNENAPNARDNSESPHPVQPCQKGIHVIDFVNRRSPKRGH
ncbi:hypothetical protein CPB84DRAFT_1786508, partial [Gymnopilus junonius]